jgi:glutamine synthetase
MLKFENVKDVESFAKSNGIEQVDVKFTNVFGGLHHITIPQARLNKLAFSSGIGIDGSSIPGFASTEKSDMILIPDLTRSFIDPFYKVKTLSFIGGVFNAESKEPVPVDPREIANKATKVLAKKTFANRSLWGPEFEFYVFSNVNYKNCENISFYEVDSNEAHWNSSINDKANLGYSIKRGKGYHAAPPNDHLFNYRSTLSTMLEDIEIEIKYHHHEGGGAGQVELEVQMKDLLEAADIGQLIKYFAKMIAYENGLTVTFMPKPLFNEAGSGMHFHQMLFNCDEPVFFQKDSNDSELSSIALSYIAGILLHASSLLGITNPSTNSYKRLTPGFEAPIRAFFSLSNRKAAVRVPAYAKLPNEKRIEFRPPDATGNIYLSMASMLLAGLDGIEKSMNPILLKLDKEETGGLLPSSLEEALNKLQQDKEYLSIDGVFTEQFFKAWVTNKLNEAIEVNSRINPYEVELYYDC